MGSPEVVKIFHYMNMRFLTVIIFSLFLLSCKNEKDIKALKTYNPSENIDQIIESEKAQKLFDEGSDYYEKSDYASAKVSFNKSFEIEKSPIALNALGILEFTKYNYRKSLKYFSQGRNLDKFYWPLYLNEARSYEKLTEFDNAEYILLKLKELCDSDYWIAYADFYLAIIYFNDKQGCEKVYEYLEKSKSITSDSDLRADYLKVKNIVDKNCDE